MADTKKKEIVVNVQESMKTPKQRMYEAHIIDSEGRLRLYHPVTQAIIVKVLEANGLEAELTAYDKALKEKNKE